MGIIDDFFNTKIGSEKSKINYKPIDTSKALSTALVTTGKIAKSTCVMATDIYYDKVAWCKSFYGTDIYKQCLNAILNQLNNLIGYTIEEIPMMVQLQFAIEYWYQPDIQNKYTKPQLRRIENEFNKGKESEELCYEMACYIWNRICTIKDLSYVLTNNDIFKIRNHCKE